MYQCNRYAQVDDNYFPCMESLSALEVVKDQTVSYLF